jgi:hypothetical protein
LPVRNGEQDLPGYFESARRFADVVVALDDGSTDATRSLLESEPLVRTLLTNPPRDDYAGWNDSENRNRLLQAAAAHDPDWIISLDVDERIDTADAAALLGFLATDAVRGDAYFLCVYRMIDGLEQYDDASLWVGRLFAYEDGLTFPSRRHHPGALPTSIATSRFRKTTIRIQHLSSSTPERRRARFQKWREADPDRTYQRSYAHILDPPRLLKPWRTRSPHLPVVRNMPARVEMHTTTLSIVVLAGDDDARAEAIVQDLAMPVTTGDLEIVVVTTKAGVAAERLRNACPAARVESLGASTTPGTARNAGLRAARGTFVAFTAPDLELTPASLDPIVQSHAAGYTMVAASCGELDAGRLREPPESCASYLRDALLEIGGFPEDLAAGEDTVAIAALFHRGYSVYADPAVRIVDRRPRPAAGAALKDGFRRGRSTGRVLLDEAVDEGRVPNDRIKRFASRGLPGQLRRSVRGAWRTDAPARTRLVRATWSVPDTTARWLGACYELARFGVASRRTRRHTAGADRANS